MTNVDVGHERYSAQAAKSRHFDRAFRYPEQQSVNPTAAPNAESQLWTGDATSANSGGSELPVVPLTCRRRRGRIAPGRFLIGVEKSDNACRSKRGTDALERSNVRDV
jgi:hypothetical protein